MTVTRCRRPRVLTCAGNTGAMLLGIGAAYAAAARAGITVAAVRAADIALARAATRPAEVDVVLTASHSLDRSEMAGVAADVVVAAEWMPINRACAGFSFGLSSADKLIRTGEAQRVLVLGVEHASAHPGDRAVGGAWMLDDVRPCAGAVLVGSAAPDQHGIGLIACGSHSAPDRGAASRSDRDGADVLWRVVETMCDVAREACDRAGVALTDIDVVAPHQAHEHIIDAVLARLRLDDAVTVARDHGTCDSRSAATIPIALHRLAAEEASWSGRLALLLGFGAGDAYAGQVIRLP